MASLEYNGQSFSQVHVARYDEEAVFDPSGVDYLYTKVTVGIVGVMALQDDHNGNPQALAPCDQQDADSSACEVRIRHALEVPRQLLTFTDASTILQVRGAAYNGPSDAKDFPEMQQDVKQGPIGKVFSIKQFDGTQAYHVAYQIETWILECPSSNTPGTILSHRWTEQQSFDKHFYVSYKRSGRILIADNFQPQSINADTIGRVASYVPLRAGFRRNSGTYVLSEDGLAMTYDVEDVQVFATFPAPAIDGKGTYSESTGKGAVIRTCSSRVSLIGAPNVSQAQLLNTAIVVCMNAFPQLSLLPAQAPANVGNAQAAAVGFVNQVLQVGAAAGGNLNALGGLAQQVVQQKHAKVKSATSSIILKASVSYGMYDNSVEVAVDAQLPFAANRSLKLPFPISTFNFTPTGSSLYGSGGVMPLPPVQGQNGQYSQQTVNQLLLLAATLGVPCTIPPNGSGGNAAV